MAKKPSMSGFIGETYLGQPYPVFFDLHTPPNHNKPPVTLITGSPGSGKTFLGLLLAAQAIAEDKVVFIIDPKGDFASLKLLERAGELKNISVWSVLDIDKENEIREQNIGMLDPLYMPGNPAQKTERTLDVIKYLVGGMTDKQINYISPLIQDEIKRSTSSGRISFMNVADILYSNRDEEIRVIGTKLRTILALPISKLICADKKIKRQEFNLSKGCFVASLIGLKTPPPDKSYDMLSAEERVSLIIMTLLTDLVMEAMKKIDNVPKVIIIDEAWTIVATEEGRTLINNAALLGRSLNQAVVLLTQSPYHLAPKKKTDAKIDNSISTMFAFKNTDIQDNVLTVENMKLPSGQGWESTLTDLRTGSCLMNDCFGRSQFIDVLVPDHWIKAFDNNPLSKKAKRK